MRRTASILIVGSFLAACTPAPAPNTNVPVPPAPPPTAAETSNPGARATAIYRHCQTQALIRCPNPNTYCRGYVQKFVEGCMIQNGAAPEYILLLTR